MIRQFSAPVAEEILKALILLYLIRRPNFTYFVDGAIYGFAAGIGFAVFENYEYVLTSGTEALGVAISRVLSTNLMHASASAMVGVAFGLSRFQRGWQRTALIILGGWLIAMLEHIIFNNMVTRLEGNSLLLIYSTVLGMGGVGVIAYLIMRGLAEEKAWIEEKLGAADRVTRQEAAIVNRLSDIGELLKPLERFFGEEKMPQVERFLTIQARLGILRKTLDKLNDAKMQTAVSKQMDDLRAEMETIRKALGAYNMLHLRGVMPSAASPLWNRMGDLITERAEARKTSQAATGGSGPNLWASLGQRATSTPAKPAAEQNAQAAQPAENQSPALAQSVESAPQAKPPVRSVFANIKPSQPAGENGKAKAENDPPGQAPQQ
jgi:hypothetical protein